MTDKQEKTFSEGQRLALLLDKLNTSQREFATSIGVTESYISTLIKGRQRISNAILYKILDKYQVNIKWLEHGEGEMFKKSHSYNAKSIVSKNASFEEIEENGNDFVDIGNGQYMMIVPLVEEYAYAGFLSGFADKEYVKELPKHSVVVSQLHKGRYFSFKVVGDSMNDNTGEAIAHGDIVTGREIQKTLWTSKFHIHKFMDYIIVHKEGILIKRIISHDVDNGIIKCRSLNPDKEKYPDFEISLAEVSKIMNIVNVTKQRLGI
ncbi:helix-turn-helix protein [compost metagenome]